MNNKIKWISTTRKSKWQENNITPQKALTKDTLELADIQGQIIDGFGGCFNELGWIALSKLEDSDREEVIDELFNQKTGCKFNFCRMPIGANDYAAEWYSHDEYDEDYNMDYFSINRDYQYLIPFIKSAMKIKPDLKMFASPWSPPTWMKFPKVYNNGTLRMEPKVLNAYALYFKKFIEAYKNEGITINQVHIQNEPFADQKFPSCLWSSEQFRVFIRDYIGPLFEKEGVDTEIWLGTLNGPTEMDFGFTGIKLDNYDRYLDNILFDEQARKYIKGIGYQWAGRHVIQKTHQSFPELKLMQTENECGDGTNTWEYAEYMFSLMRHYLDNGVSCYTYWNMVLEPQGTSTWGWNQNAMITIEPDTKKVIYNPEFYVMKHFSHFVEPGAKLLKTTGHWTSASSVFENPDGNIVIIINNALDREREFNYAGNGKDITVTLKPNSFNTFVIEK